MGNSTQFSKNTSDGEIYRRALRLVDCRLQVDWQPVLNQIEILLTFCFRS